FQYVLRATRRPTLLVSKPAFVQGAVSKAVTGTTTTVAFNQANTSGNLIVAYVVWDNPGTVVDVRDTRGNAYTPASPRVQWSSFASGAQVFYAANVIGGGTNTVTATFSSGLSTFGLIYVIEYSGVAKTNPLDPPGSGQSGSSLGMDSGTATT